MSYLKHKLGRTFYISKGKKKIPLICLHGGPGSGCGGQVPLLELADERQVVIYDQLGCGKSTKTSEAKWDMKVFVEELDLLAKGLGFDKFFIFGVSCGATLALEYYLAHPEKVEGIVFQSPFFSTKDWQADAIKLIKKMHGKNKKNKQILLDDIAGKKVSDEDFDRAIRAYYLKHVVRSKKVYDARAKSKKNSEGSKVYNYMWGRAEHHVTGSLITYEREKFLHKVKVPTLVVCGEHDEATPKNGKKYAKAMKSAEFKVVAGGSHALTAEKPKKLKKLVRKFLKENS